jgi:hypothetical protein
MTLNEGECSLMVKICLQARQNVGAVVTGALNSSGSLAQSSDTPQVLPFCPVGGFRCQHRGLELVSNELRNSDC